MRKIVPLMLATVFSLATLPWTFGQYLTSKPGPRLFVDSAWGYSLSLPKGYVLKREAKPPDAPSYQAWVDPGGEQYPYPRLSFSVANFREYFRSLNPDDLKNFTAGADTVYEMVSVLCHMQENYVTAESNVEVQTDSILERRTDSGLRLFIQYSRESVSPRGQGKNQVLVLTPTYYVAVPCADNWTYLTFPGTSDPFPAKLRKIQWNLVKSVGAWVQ